MTAPVVCRYALGEVKALTCYKGGCRERSCRRASSRWYLERTNTTLRGMVPARPATERILALKESGMTMQQIAASSGLAQSTLRRLVGSARQRPATVPAATARAVANVVPATHGHVSVDATGTRRRIQALQSLGWTITAISEAAGLSAANYFCGVGNGRITRVFVSTRDAVKVAYDELWDRRPAPTAMTKATITRAKARGYAPPLAWDDDTIDDRSARPSMGRPSGNRVVVDEVAIERLKRGQRVPSNRPERKAAVQQLSADGVPLADIADRLGMDWAAVKKARNRINAAERASA